MEVLPKYLPPGYTPGFLEGIFPWLSRNFHGIKRESVSPVRNPC